MYIRIRYPDQLFTLRDWKMQPNCWSGPLWPSYELPGTASTYGKKSCCWGKNLQLLAWSGVARQSPVVAVEVGGITLIWQYWHDWSCNRKAVIVGFGIAEDWNGACSLCISFVWFSRNLASLGKLKAGDQYRPVFYQWKDHAPYRPRPTSQWSTKVQIENLYF